MILHEWWGIMPHNRSWANRLADIGHLTLVVYLYDGRTTDNPEVASEMMRNIDQTRADRKLLAAIDYLYAPGRRIATFGCSFGGKESMPPMDLPIPPAHVTMRWLTKWPGSPLSTFSSAN
jgi:carboxymethylenebutenolidase